MVPNSQPTKSNRVQQEKRELKSRFASEVRELYDKETELQMLKQKADKLRTSIKSQKEELLHDVSKYDTENYMLLPREKPIFVEHPDSALGEGEVLTAEISLGSPMYKKEVLVIGESVAV